jgi:hypothetical protein
MAFTREPGMDINPRSVRVRHQGIGLGTRGLRVRFILLYEVSACTGGYRDLPVRAPPHVTRCRSVPGADGWYRDIRATTEQPAPAVLVARRVAPTGAVSRRAGGLVMA